MEGTAITRDVDARASARGRLAVGGGLLLAEYLIVSFRFDALTVAERGGLWGLFARAGAIAPLAVVFVTALLLLKKGDAPSLPPIAAKISAPLLVAHGLAYAAFLFVTSRAFGTPEPPAGPVAAWLGAFLVTGAATALTLLVALVGTAILRRVASLSLLTTALVAVLAWAAGQFTTELWTTLSRMTLTVVAAALRAISQDIQADIESNVLELGDFGVHVSPECSGLEGVGLIAVLLSAYLFTFRDRLRFPRALWLVPAGIVGVWLGNSLRIAILMLVGAHFDAELAYGGFHSKLGWVIFCAVTLGVAVLAHRSRFFSADAERADETAETENPTAAYLVPLMALVAAGLVTTMFARDVDYGYGLRLVAAGVALYGFRRYYRDLSREWSWTALAAGVVVGVAWLATASVPAPDGVALADLPLWWLVVRTAGSVVMVPVVEELAFRGCLLRWLVQRDFTEVPWTAWTPWAIAGSSLAFGLLHERWFAATLVGVAYGFLQIRRGRILDAVIAHAATNAVISAWVFVTANPAYWS